MRYPHIKQHDEKDCGAACLSMISEYYGLKLPLAKFRDLIKVDNFGASIYGIVTGSKKIGFDAEALEGDKEELLNEINNKNIIFPFIARIINDEMYEHYIVVYKINKNSVIIGDPSRFHNIKVPIESFFSSWQKQIITFKLNGDFSKRNEQKGAFIKFFKPIFGQKKILTILFIMSLFISSINIFSAFIFEYIINNVTAEGNTSYYNEDMHYVGDECDEEHTFSKLLFQKIENADLKTICISIILLYIVQGIVQMLRSYTLANMIKKVDISISLGYYNHLIDLPIVFFGTRKTGELISRFSDASNIREAISTTTLTIMIDTLMAIITGIFLFNMSHLLFIFTLFIMSIYSIVMIIFRNPIKIINKNVMEMNAQTTSYLKESIDGIETIKAHQYEQNVKRKTKKLFEKFVNQTVKGSIIFNLQEVLLTTISCIGMVLLLWIGSYLCIENIITIGTLITFYYLLNQFLEPVKNLIELQPILQTAIVASERLNDVLDTPIEENNENLLNKGNLFGDINFKNVNFRYGNRQLVLKNIDLHIKKGTTVAIVGESGCGKTTIAKLLMAFYNYESGGITIDGKSITKYSPNLIREKIAYISQDIFLFSDTIYNNLRMNNKNITNEEIEKICCLCHADQFIRKLPYKYETVLEENGDNLSAGQKQRLAIARALLHNPDILIMDEATSNLDIITEESIKKIISNFSNNITCIIIAHRLNTICQCDYIYVMENGEIKEKGTHECLLKKNGLYTKYYKIDGKLCCN